jgi:hypothetical protein
MALNAGNIIINEAAAQNFLDGFTRYCDTISTISV